MSDRAPIIVEVTSPSPIAPEEILVLRRGPGANCSSIGSALDILFVSATAAGVILVLVAAAFGDAKPVNDEGKDESAG
jgi:hypothetical protein